MAPYFGASLTSTCDGVTQTVVTTGTMVIEPMRGSVLCT